MSAHPSPLHVASSLAILAFDWLVYAVTMSHVHDWPYATVAGAVGAALAVAIIEQQRNVTPTQIALRAAIAGAVVAVPLPLLGTLVAAAFLVWAALARTPRAH